MQRWIVAAAVVLCLLLGGGAFAYWKVKQNGPDFSYVPLPIPPEFTPEERQQLLTDMKARLVTDLVLTGVARDCGIEAKWDLPSEQAAVEDLKRRMIFEAGEYKFQGIPAATINIGFKGKVSEHNDLQALANRMMKDVQKVINPAKEQESGAIPANY